MRILFPTDGSEAASRALVALIDRFEWFRDPPQLTLLNAHPPIPYGAAKWVSERTVADFYEEEFAKVLGPARQELDRRGIAYAVETRRAEAAPAIIALAQSGRFDCIAMGTHGHTALANLVLGSVAQKVVAMAQIPVLLLK